MEKRKPAISIIVPVYNVEQYLSSCIRSILRQTYRDFELILVDDGSPDRCGEICDGYAEQDCRIRVIHQPNGGVSRARNVGLDIARGEWICFIDADDVVTPRYLASFLTATSTRPDVDIIVQGAIGFYGKKIRNKFIFDDYSGKINKCLTKELFDMGTPWGKLFRLDIIREYRLAFSEGLPYGEDTIFYYRYLLFVKKITLCRSTRYLNRTDNPNSATKKFYSPFIYWKVYEEKTQLLRQLYAKHHLSSPYPKPEDIVLLKSIVSMAYSNGKAGEYNALVKHIRTSNVFSILGALEQTFSNTIFCLFLSLPCFLQKIVWYCKGMICKYYTMMKKIYINTWRECGNCNKASHLQIVVQSGKKVDYKSIL